MRSLVAMDERETHALLVAAKQHSPRAHAMVVLAIRHGMRASEVTGLRLGHVNLREGWIRIERLKGSLTNMQPLERHPGQPLLDERKALGAWLRERQDDGSDILFTSSHGGRMNRSTFFRLWRQVAQAAGLSPEKWHPHVAKHSVGRAAAHRISRLPKARGARFSGLPFAGRYRARACRGGGRHGRTYRRSVSPLGEDRYGESVSHQLP
jgi:integrase